MEIDNDTVVSQFSKETTFNSLGRFLETILTKMISWLGLGFTIKYIIHIIYYNVHTNQITSVGSDLEHKRLSKKIVMKFTASESRVHPCHSFK